MSDKLRRKVEGAQATLRSVISDATSVLLQLERVAALMAEAEPEPPVIDAEFPDVDPNCPDCGHHLARFAGGAGRGWFCVKCDAVR